ncbi:MAG TPA: hypothetical protein VGC79_26635, partial [Polyangiaceae bacterium]
MTEGSGERATRNDVLAVYEPKQGSVKSAVIVITLLVLWGMFRVPCLLHGARAFSLDFLAGIALLVYPITFGLWGGTRVELLADRVYAYRFGRPKHEYRLTDLVGSGTKYGANGLHFRQGFVSADAAFIGAAKARARQLGVVIAPNVMQISAHEATFELDQMRLDPDVCVGCGMEPARLRAFLAWQGVELVATRYVLARDLAMPVCGPCDRRRKRWRRGQMSLLALAALPLLLGPAVLGAITWPAALIAGGVVYLAALLYLGNFAQRIADWRGVGVRVGPLSADSTTATMCFANPESLQR